MNYADHGGFAAAARLDHYLMGPYLHTRDVSMAAAELFYCWWGRHLELHRTIQAA